MSDKLHEDFRRFFIVAGYINSPHEHFCATLDIVIFLTGKCSSTIHRESIVAFHLQQLLGKGATMLHYTHTTCMFVFNM